MVGGGKLLGVCAFLSESKGTLTLSGDITGEAEAVMPLFAQGKARFIERAWALQVQAADVARALGITRQEAARLFDLAHPTKIDALSKALEVLGAQLDLSLSLLPQGPSPLLNEKPRRGRTPDGSRRQLRR